MLSRAVFQREIVTLSYRRISTCSVHFSSRLAKTDFAECHHSSIWASTFLPFEKTAVPIDRTLERAVESNPKMTPEKVADQLEAEPIIRPKLQFLQPLMFAVLFYLFAVRIQQLKHLSRLEQENQEFNALTDDEKRSLFETDENYTFYRSILDLYFGTCFTALVFFRLAALRRFTIAKQAWFCGKTGVTTVRVQSVSIASNAPTYINIPPNSTDFVITADLNEIQNIPALKQEPENTVDKILQKLIPNNKISSSAIGDNGGLALVFPSCYLDMGAAFGTLENLTVIINGEVAQTMHEKATETKRFSETAFGAKFIRETAKL